MTKSQVVMYTLIMLKMTVGELKAQFSTVIDEVKQGNSVEVLYGRLKKPLAVISPVGTIEKKKRRIPGLWVGKGELTEVGDGKITLEEFFGVNSLDEVKPIII